MPVIKFINCQSFLPSSFQNTIKLEAHEVIVLQLRSLLFWDVTQCIFVVVTNVLGQLIGPIFLDCSTLE
jgi:hypothetical protein